ncbi:Sensory transduction protein regX3 OS=Lysinibacillus sphaericus OX=1421 GN=regX3_1 PE=4 SV=1 [Lysinibacillus sphaericus]
MLTANDMETDIVAGLEMGADDYITKPFSLAVLRARVNTVENKWSQNEINLNKITLFLTLTAWNILKTKGGELSKTEQKLLKF